MKPGAGLGEESRPRLAKKARLRRDRVDGKVVLLGPERGLVLNESGARIAALLDGVRSVREIAAEIAGTTGAEPEIVLGDVLVFLDGLASRGLLGGPQRAARRAPDSTREAERSDAHPYTLIAELTYRCPLRCPYCSNPVALERSDGELSTDEWARVFTEAEALGVMQVHLTGGEPLARRDLEALVAHANSLDLYTNLITSGVPLTEARLDALAAAGLDNVQLSIQDASAASSDAIAGHEAFEAKRAVARWVKERGLPLTMNVVLHAANIEHVAALGSLAEELGADRLELANTQYLGWALVSREALLPTRAQLERARDEARALKERLEGAIEVVFVWPDYFAGRPRGCMEGWARRYVTVSPDGLVLPCHAARTIAGLRFERVRDRPLGDIWSSSPGLDAFRGDAWMREPCKTCDRRHEDYGGCRCQAFHLTGDASVTDPACELAPRHDLITLAREAKRPDARHYVFRRVPTVGRPR